jgi:hypothetical protein
MRAISVTQIEEITRLANELDDQAETVRSAIRDANIALAVHHQKLEAVVGGYNTAAAALRQLYEELADEAEEYFGSRSEQWQASDTGQQYEVWKDNLRLADSELLDIDEIELADIDEPELFDGDSWMAPENQP